MNKLAFTTILVLLITSCTHLTPQQRMLSQEKDAGLLYTWSQLVDNNQISFRAIVSTPDCPSINVDGTEAEMNIRASVDETAALQICEFRASQKTSSAKIGNVEMPVAHSDLNRVVAFGDTGCRMKKSGILTIIQDCHNPDKWSFEKISQNAAAKNPDLAIHLGDYNYRDIDCPADNAKCAGLTSKNTWKSWEQDVIRPMNALLKTTPFIFVRGNHEGCGSFGTSWFKFFSFEKYDVKDKCTNASPTYSVKIDGIEFVNLDSASEDNQRSETLALQKDPQATYLWLLTHRPFLAESSDVNLKKAPRFSETMQKPGAVQLVMAGHTHIGSFVNFKENKPPELVLGNGGVLVDYFTSGPVENNSNQVNTVKENGYGFFNRINPDNWQLMMINKDGKVRINCKLLQNTAQKTEMNCE